MSSPRLAFLLSGAALAALAVSGCSVFEDPGPKVAQTRDVAAFTRVEADGPVDVHVRVGERRHVAVRAGEKLVDDIRTEVRGATLTVSYDGSRFRDGGLVVDVDVPTLDAIETSGPADVFATGFAGRALAIRTSGPSDVEADGRVDRLTLVVSGPGDADLAGLTAREAQVDVGGSGDVDVRAIARLDVDVDGSGDVRYHGDPVVTERVDGSGDLDHAG